MFGTIRKHQTWLWAIIITITIISFVVFFSPYSKMNDGGGTPQYGSINGQKVTREAYMKAMAEVYLRYLVQTGRWPDDDRNNNFDAMRETYQWLLVVQKQEEMRIQPSADVVADAARQILTRMQVPSPQVFSEKVLAQKGFTMTDFERFLRHFLGMQELMSTVGASGRLVTPTEAQALYERENQELQTEAVVFTASNYLASVTVTPEAVSQFYSNRLSYYRIPDRVQVAYVEFPVSNYLAMAEAELTKTNLADIIDANYQRLGSNYFKDAKSPEEAKAKIRQELFRSRALMEARRKAAEFDEVLFSMEPHKAENLGSLAKSNNLAAKVTAPFDREAGPEEIPPTGSSEFAKAAFTRTAEEPFSEPVVTLDAVYVLALTKRVPSEIPPLDQIRDKVTADFKLAHAASKAREEGTRFAASVTNALAQGKTFSAAATEASLKPILLPPFSLSSRSISGEIQDHVSLNQLQEAAFRTTVGQASPVQMTPDGAFVLFVRAKLPIDETKMKNELPGFVNYLRQNRMSEAFGDWFRREADRGLRNTPLNQPKPSTIDSKTAKS